MDLKIRDHLMNITIEIATECGEWHRCKHVNRSLFNKILHMVLSEYAGFNSDTDYELSVLLTDDSQMSRLNSEFRGKDKPTNVLSFPDNNLSWQELEIFQTGDYFYLGDIAFSYQTIEKEAQLKSISFQDHFIHLAIHAILHLIGFDHIYDKDAEAMEKLEIKLLEKFGISSPY